MAKSEPAGGSRGAKPTGKTGRDSIQQTCTHSQGFTTGTNNAGDPIWICNDQCKGTFTSDPS
jgi:hypothetical protein